MKDLLIVGAGMFAREVLQVIKDINNKSLKWNVLGFLDDNPQALDGVDCDKSIVGSIMKWKPKSNEVFVCGIATPTAKEKVVEYLKSKGASFETVISPRTYIADFVTVGEGVVMLAGSVGPNVAIGNYVTILDSMIGQESALGDYSTTTAYVNVVSATLGKRVFIGSHSVVLSGRRVGDDAFICVGSIVFNHVKPNAKVMGYPAKPIDF